MTLIMGVCDLAAGPGVSTLLESMLKRRVLCRQHRVDTRLDRGMAFAAAGDVSVPRVGSVTDNGAVFHVAFNGRIDNRLEIGRDLETGDGDGLSDAELVLRSYVRFGDGCADRLIGDFAFAVWDSRRQRLLLARDAMGVKPLYYAAASRVLAFSTQLQPLLVMGEQSSALDEEYLAEYVATGLVLTNRTPYRDITCVLPGHVAIFDAQGMRSHRYWQPAISSTGVSSEAETTAGFRDLFTQAVRCSLRGDGAIWSELSGGLDSSSIVCMAKEIQRDEPDLAPDLETLTVIFEEAVLSDEREWASHVTAHCGYPPHYINGDEYGLFTLMDEGIGYWDEPSTTVWNYAMMKRYGTLVSQADAVAVLSGAGAEAVITCEAREPLYLADLLRQGHFRRFARALSAWQRAERKPFANILLTYCLRPLFRPASVRYSSGIDAIPSWVPASAVRRLDMRRYIGLPSMPRRFRSAAVQSQYERVGRVRAFLARGYLEKCVEFRYPFLHRPLVEFMLAAPWEHKLKPGRAKPILRDAMRGTLPERVRRRTQIVTGGHASYVAIAREWAAIERLLREPILADLRLVDADELYRSTELARHGHSPYLPLLLAVLALELWLRHALGDDRLARTSDDRAPVGVSGRPT